MRWWGTKQSASEKLVKEVRAMQVFFSKKNHYRVNQTSIGGYPYDIETLSRELNTEDPSMLYWDISFRMHETSPLSSISSDETYSIRILYESNHPLNPPSVKFTSHTPPSHTPHYIGNVMCLYHRGSGRPSWDPAESTGATMGVWATQWIRAYIYWRANRVWLELD